MTELELANVVGTITYQQELDLAALTETFADRDEITSVTYEPAENHWLQSRFPPDETYVAFYRSGRCSIAGCKSVEHFETVVEQVNNVMRELLEFEYMPAVDVSNIVASADLGFNFSLEALTIELGMERTEYEPEQFPALIYRDSEFVMLVFSSGKLLCTGLTDRQAVSEAIENMASRIQAVV
ncbi:TATA-box-binding protein [Haloarchaeobius salinus]|uniref:TATA-box-binding protein n=1 Tax=Haloarchaeobius salinus TaxID=1198298 RepID=UPI00210D5802